MSKAKQRPDAGALPKLLWIAKSALMVDHRYQRELASRRSQALIARLAAGWKWAHCLPLVVTDNCDGTFNVIDGQHRMAAALQRDDIPKLPCYQVDTDTLQDEALAFVAVNKDRVQPTSLAVYHAMVAGKDPVAVEVAAACKRAGVIVLKTPKMLDVCDANETQSIGALSGIARKHGGGLLARVLKVLLAAWPEGPGSLRSSVIQGVALLLAADPKTSDAKLVRVLENVPPEDLIDRARRNRMEHKGRTVEALAADLRKRLARKGA